MKIKTHCKICNRRAKVRPIRLGENLCHKHYKMKIENGIIKQ